jgi:transcription elongation factor SPT6
MGNVQVREGFIIDEDEEDEQDRATRRREKRKRRRERDEEEAALDEEDLDLIGEANPEFEQRAPTQVCGLPNSSGKKCI